MAFPSRIFPIALAVLLPASVQAQSTSDFSLEPAPTPTATPQAQGPADTRSGVQIRPRVVNTPTPTPTPTPAPTPEITPEAPPIDAAATREAPTALRVPRNTPLPTITPRAVETSDASPLPDRPDAAPAEREGAAPTPPALPGAQPSTSPEPLPEAADTHAEEGLPWRLVAAAAALLALLGAGFLFHKRRSGTLVHEIESPVVARAKPPAAVPLAEAVQLQVESEKLIRSAAFATLKYRLTLRNRTDAQLTDIAVGIDLVSAHAEAAMEEQVAVESTALEKRHEIARIPPRQFVTLDGQVQLPLAQAHVIRQGRFPLLVPLMRVRVDGPGEGVMLKTFVVGLGSPDGGRLQPIRLDEGPRTYGQVAQRELA